MNEVGGETLLRWDERWAKEHLASLPLTDSWNSNLFSFLHKTDVCWCPSLGGWLIYDGKRWLKDELSQIEALAKGVARRIYGLAQIESSPARAKDLGRHAIKTESSNGIRAMLELSKCELAVPAETFDKGDFLLNCKNGTRDLKTGELKPHSREDHLTKIVNANYDPEAKCPLWERFLLEVMGGNESLVRYLQKAIGYALTADIRHQCFFVLYGSGSNGKSTFLTTLQNILGDYVAQLATDTLMLKNNRGTGNDLVRLRGTRLAVTVESGKQRRLDEVLMKQITGGDKICGRLLYCEPVEFFIQAKFFLATNFPPLIDGADSAMVRRIRLIPFTVSFPENKQDLKLAEKLGAERDGTLRWAVEGCKLWLEEGLGTPPEVTRAVSEYSSEMDCLGRFLDEKTSKTGEVASGALYGAFQVWCEANGETAVTQKELTSNLSRRGFARTKATRGPLRDLIAWQGLSLSNGIQDKSGLEKLQTVFTGAYEVHRAESGRLRSVL